MKKRIGIINIVIYDITVANKVNFLLSQYSEYILSRNGLPLHNKGINIVNVIIEASANDINALTGKLGRLPNLEVKCLFTKIQTDNTLKE
ncbi:MAG: TM1266 family iron-only hydrogenase system putative regulator [Bacteroidales bacterium]